MPIAAVPRYIGKSYAEHASPALRFDPYLAVWTTRDDQQREFNDKASRKSREASVFREMRERLGNDAAVDHAVSQHKLPRLWTRNDAAARRAWEGVTSLTPDDQHRLKALVDRQSTFRHLVGASEIMHLEARSAAPFATGLGNEHPLENGFAFLNPYGLPYLPGSGVKGVVRRAAQELAVGQWGDAQGWNDAPDYAVQINGGDAVNVTTLDALFGRETSGGDKHHLRGALQFWDVIPRIAGDRLAVEIMTPHQSHYYQQKPDQGSETPHDSGSPTPISFLTVPPGSEFTFHVRCDLSRLRKTAPQFAEEDLWRKLLAAAFEHAFDWLGFGAKTAVGYGAMRRDREREDRERHEAKERARKLLAERKARDKQIQEEAARRKRLAEMDPLDRAIQEVLDARHDKGMKETTAILKAIEGGKWTGPDKVEVAQRLKSRMLKEKTWKETSQKKKPEKDKAHQNTLRVMGWLNGE